MKILYGICGFGNGHSARSGEVLQELLQRGHQVAVFGFLNSQRYCAAHFPQVPVYEVKVPILHVGRWGIDFLKSAQEPFNILPDAYTSCLLAMHQALEFFGGKPDLVLSDYEWIAGQFAYALDIPLVTIDQQSKFAGFQFPDIGQFSRVEEKARLAMFFPHVEARYACSFFQVTWSTDPTFKAELIPPILRRDILALRQQSLPTHEDEVVVYFSPHGELRQPMEEVYRLFQRIRHKRFIVFNRKPQAAMGNIEFRQFDGGAFLQAIAQAESVITTGGHNLLSELVCLQKPVYTLPFDTFDQRCCASIVEACQIGKSTLTFSKADLDEFFQRLPEYSDYLATGQGLMTQFDGLSVLMGRLQQSYGV